MWTTVDMKQQQQPNTTESSVDLPISMFPVENPDLIYKRWEDDIIWDSEVRVLNKSTETLSFNIIN